MLKPLFPAGHLVATPGAIALLESNHVPIMGLVARHLAGDWGEALCEEDRHANDTALKVGTRILSAYRVGKEKVWIITEWDRSATTVLLPEDY